LDDFFESGFGIADLDAIIGRMFDVIKDLGALEQGLGGDTAPVEADSTEGFPFDNSRFEAKLGGPNSGNITAGTASDNNKIVIHGE
jgi:hypothetical protein